MRKIQLYKIIFLICFWVSCTIFIVFMEASVLGFKSEYSGQDYSFPRILISAILITIVGASLLGSLDVLFLNKYLRKKPLGLILITKTSIYLFFILFFISITRMYLHGAEIDRSMFSVEVMKAHLDFLLSPRSIMNIAYWAIACISAIFILQVNEKFGQGVLLNFLMGKYHSPKEENRIFMFLDLKSSTTFAEKLGHLIYSRFIQDCFYDINDLVTTYSAKIYQYVGDEVVVSWKFEEGIYKGNCIKLFFAFDSLLKNKSEYYIKKYAVTPEFKAGLHCGNVTVAEVGEIKKELAYHGDVLNTAARIQGRCNDFNSKILISESLKNSLEPLKFFDFNYLDNVLLRGKKKSVNIYDVKFS